MKMEKKSSLVPVTNRMPTLKTKLDGMDEKLDGITEKVNTLADKPGKRWESLVGCVLSALAGAFILWLASGMPGAGG